MSSDALNYAKLATSVAIKAILGAKEKVLSGKQLTPDEAKFVGKSIGWLAVVTAGAGENDVFAKLNTLSEDVISELEGNTGSKISAEPPAVLAGGKTRKMLGGAPLLISLVMGGVAVLFAGRTGLQMKQARDQRAIIYNEAKAQIANACPADIVTGIPPSVSFFDFSGKEAADLADYNSRMDVCAGVKQAMGARVAQAEAAVKRADSLVPKAVGAIVSTASLVTMGPGAATPAGISASTVAGTAVAQLTEAMFATGGNVAPGDVTKYVDQIAKGFPAASPSPAPAPGGRRTRSKRMSRRLRNRRRTMRR